MQFDLRLCQQQANLTVLIRQLPRVFQQRQRFVVFAFLNQFERLLRFQLFFTRQHFVEQSANRFFRLRALESVDRLTILEQIHGWDRAQPKLGRHHLLSVAVQFCQQELTVVLRREALQYRRQLQTVLATFGPEIEQHGFGHRHFKCLVQVRFSDVDNILYGHTAFSFINLTNRWGMRSQASTHPRKILSIMRPGSRRLSQPTAWVTRVTG
ncbi:hypothetical protein D3C71_954520 [compost metagenome]